jgi:hypothetical protein
MRNIAPALISVLIFQLYGCGSLLNPMFDENKVFSSERNSEVGENIDWLLQHNARYHWIEPGQQKIYNSNYAVVETSPNINEHQFKTPQCSWALEVNQRTNKVVAWKYLGDPSNCKSKKFFEGAW